MNRSPVRFVVLDGLRCCRPSQPPNKGAQRPQQPAAGYDDQPECFSADCLHDRMARAAAVIAEGQSSRAERSEAAAPAQPNATGLGGDYGQRLYRLTKKFQAQKRD